MALKLLKLQIVIEIYKGVESHMSHLSLYIYEFFKSIHWINYQILVMTLVMTLFGVPWGCASSPAAGSTIWAG